MLSFCKGPRRSRFASAWFVALLASAVWCVSCGTKAQGLTGPGRSDDAGGDDGGSGCPSGGSCSGSSGGGVFGGSGGDGGSGVPVPVAPSSNPVNDTNCPGSLSASQFSSLKAASANSAALKWLYPYSGTVFPGGLAAPVLQWSQTGTPDGLYLHLHSNKYDFTGCYAGTSALTLQLDAKEWATAYAQSAGKSDPLTVELSAITGGTVSGPITETWIFAKGNLAGVVYYNTYGSKLVPGQTNQNGAVIRIQNSQAQAFLYTTTGASPIGPCVSCHSLSADGSTLAAQQHMYPGNDPLNGKGSMTFGLKSTPMPNPMSPQANTTNDDWGFSAVYPDGSYLLTSGEPSDTTGSVVFPNAANNNVAMIGVKPATLYDTRTGAVVATTGLSTQYAMMPMFSPDGKHVVYTDGDASAGGHTITVMNFDVGSKTFSNATQVYHDDTKFPGWPFFTPDGLQVVFALGNTNNFASETPLVANSVFASELYVVPATGGAAHRLDESSGYDKGNLHLPNGMADEGVDFYPTVNPVSSGGYFWAYFTSRRAYGNLYNKGPGDIGSKAIWVTAIDIGAGPGVDPSHPAFYLPGQELGSGNIRAFAVLPVCKGDGASCESGIDCCGGSCTMGACGVPKSCAAEGDKCTPTVPCCVATDRCLGGYCGFVVE